MVTCVMRESFALRATLQLERQMRILTTVILIALASAATGAQEAAPNVSSAAAQFEAGMNYLTGVGVNTDVQKGVEQIRRAAERGYAPAQTAMGYFLQTGTYIAGNAGDAANWYEKSAKQGDTIAEWALSSLYYKGNGVNHDLPKAEEWARKAA